LVASFFSALFSALVALDCLAGDTDADVGAEEEGEGAVERGCRLSSTPWGLRKS
jgi:hypothetical protein